VQVYKIISTDTKSSSVLKFSRFSVIVLFISSNSYRLLPVGTALKVQLNT